VKRILLDWQEIQSVSLGEKRILALSDDSALIFMACSNLYNNRDVWRFGDDDVTDAQWDDISKAIGQAEKEIMSNLVGVILPHVMGEPLDFNMLPCDGSSYLRDDYPLLYEAIDPFFHIDADTFSVPDLRTRFPFVADGVDYNLGDTGGEIEHTLLTTEMPEHTHDNAPHAHTESTANATVGAAITGVPVPSAFPAVGLTSFESISINPSGQSEPHNNMPPFYALNWAIVAG